MSTESPKSIASLESLWASCSGYTVLKPLNSSMTLMKACDRDGRKVAIRLCPVNTPNEARRILREIAVLRRLQEVPGNVFTTELIEVLLPSGE